MRAQRSGKIASVRDEWGRLAEQIRRQRIARGFRRQTDLAAAAGVSKSTVSNLERGLRESYDAYTLASVEAALGWRRDAIADVLAGQEPRTLEDEHLSALHLLWPRLDERSKRLVVALARELTREG